MPGIDDGVEIDINGDISLVPVTVAQALFPGATVTPLQNFSFLWNGAILSFSQGETQVVTPDLMAALAAQSAPYTTP